MGSMNAGSVWKVILLMVWVSGSATAQLFSTSSTITVQGSIFCISGNKAIPVRGANARVECKALDGSLLRFFSEGANDHGFYTATSPNRGLKPESCKVFLNWCPLPNCRVPTNTNGGKTGASIIAFSLLSKNYSVKPFFYAPK